MIRNTARKMEISPVVNTVNSKEKIQVDTNRQLELRLAERRRELLAERQGAQTQESEKRIREARLANRDLGQNVDVYC